MTARWARGAPRARMTAGWAPDDGCVDDVRRAASTTARPRRVYGPIDLPARTMSSRAVRGRDGRARARVTRSSVVGRRSSCDRSVSHRFHIGFTLVSNRACGRWVSHRGGVYTKGARRDARAKTGTRELASTHWTRDRVRRRVVDPRTYARDGAASERVDENRSRVASRIRTARVDEERRRNGTTSRLGALGDANSAFGPFV